MAKVLGLDPESDLAASSTQQITHIETFGKCLWGKGFEGFPLVYPEPAATPSPRLVDDFAWVREFGFGIFTLSLENFEVGGSGSDARGAVQEFVASLSPQAADRLFLEYDGTAESSCMAEAEAAVAALANVESLSVFADATLEIGELAVADPRYSAAIEVYAGCMADGGLSEFGSPGEVVDAVNAEFEQFLGQIAFNPGSDINADFVSQLNAPSRAELAERQEWEVELAVQSYECEIPIRSDLATIYREAELSWIAENQERLGS